VLVLRLDRWGRFVADCVDTLRPLTSYGVAWLASLPGAQHGGRRDRLLELKAAGKSWEAISRELGVPVGTPQCPAKTLPRNRTRFCLNPQASWGACAPLLNPSAFRNAY
jgi:hypothetical protein